MTDKVHYTNSLDYQSSGKKDWDYSLFYNGHKTRTSLSNEKNNGLH